MGLCWLSPATVTAATRRKHHPTYAHTSHTPGGHTLAPECTASAGPNLSPNHLPPIRLSRPCDIRHLGKLRQLRKT